jgi:hypothetical protein
VVQRFNFGDLLNILTLPEKICCINKCIKLNRIKEANKTHVNVGRVFLKHILLLSFRTTEQDLLNLQMRCGLYWNG